MGVPAITLRLCPRTRGAVPKEQTLRAIAGRMLNVGGGSFDCKGTNATLNRVPRLGALIPFGIEAVTVHPEFAMADIRKQTLAVLMDIFQIAIQSTKGSLAERLSKANMGMDIKLEGSGVQETRPARVRPAPAAVAPPRVVAKAPKSAVISEAKLPQIQPGKHKFTAFEKISLPLAGLSTIAGLIGGEILYYLGASKLFLALDFVGAGVSFIFFCALAGMASARRSNIMLKGLVYFNDKVFGENSEAMKQGLIEIGVGRGVPLETFRDIEGRERMVARREEQDQIDKLFKKYLPGTWISSRVASDADGYHRDILYFKENYENGYRQVDLLRLRERFL
ncbi:MAG: hypothetical protein WC645_06870 [Candidatus Margulisiibacteriota bacterium]